MTRASWIGAAALLLGLARPAFATIPRDLPFPVRGRILTLEVYHPTRPPIGTIIMGSGDVGWVGLSVKLAEQFSDRGYLVVGLNVRQYLTIFRSGPSHLTVDDGPSDFRAMADFLRAQHLYFSPVILSGVSEGAALSVLAASNEQNHQWVDGVITMGIPAVAELAWKWSDFTSWITKHDASEPSFSPYDFIGGVAPLPLVMIQSRKDEYVPETDYLRCHARAREPKKLVLIDASNHRFTDRQRELMTEFASAIEWVQANAASHAATSSRDRH